jgi:peptide/nickel transport system substrate-binding protein
MRRAFGLGGLALGFALLVASALPPPAGSDASRQFPRGGTLRIDLSSDFDYIDSSLAYFTHSWQLQNATQLKLLSFPDTEGAAGRRVVPDAAEGLPKVSDKGKTYTFTIKRGFKFSDGSAVTSANFAAAIKRALDPRMQSPAKPFLDGVVSYRTPNDQTLVIRLKQPTPDFLQRMTMPFFSAIPTNRPVNPKGVGAPLVSAGPYYVRSWIKSRSAELARNPFYPGPREGQPDQIVYNLNASPATQYTRCRSGVSDVCTDVAPAQHSRLAQEFGINKGRYFIRKNVAFWYLALNNDSKLFRNNPKLRQAVNYAIDRPQIVRQHGYLGGGRTDQILPPGMPGFRNGNIYPLGGENLTRAQSLARGNTRSGKAVFYTFNTAPGPSVAEVVRFNLKQIGIDVEIKQFSRAVVEQRVGRRGERYDIALQSWGEDYPDPYDFINILLSGRNIRASNNTNDSYFSSPAWNQRMERAARLTGAARLRAYGNLDLDLMRNQAPIAPYLVSNDRIFVSANVASFSYNPIYGLDLLGTSLVAPPTATPPPPPPPPGPPPPPPPLSCSQPLTATLTTAFSELHGQVYGQCDAFLPSGWNFTELHTLPKRFSAWSVHASGPCTPSGQPPLPHTLTCPAKTDGRVCAIIDLEPEAVVGDSVRVRLLKDSGVVHEATLQLGPEQAPCTVGP